MKIHIKLPDGSEFHLKKAPLSEDARLTIAAVLIVFGPPVVFLLILGLIM